MYFINNKTSLAFRFVNKAAKSPALLIGPDVPKTNTKFDRNDLSECCLQVGPNKALVIFFTCISFNNVDKFFELVVDQ